MRRWMSGTVVLLMLAMTVAVAQEVATDSKTKVRRRLPDHFVKIGIGLEQREQIYAIQDKYEAQISELEKQIAELEVKQSAEILGLLTDRQRTQLEKYVAEEKERDAERAIERDSGDAEDSDEPAFAAPTGE